jgi:GT2 family glycosyltransferase
MTSATSTERHAHPSSDPCLVSAVVVSWNTRDLLRQCLESFQSVAETLRRPTELIVIDNASTDGSAEMVRAAFPAARLTVNRENNGFAAATNQGLAQSRGRYVLLLNPDTVGSPGYLEALISFLEQHPTAGAAGPRLVGRSGEDQVSCFPLPTLSKELWRLFHLDRLHPFAAYPVADWGYEAPRQVESVQGACLLLRREALAEIGPLDERFFVYTEEIDLCRRLVNRGWRIFWVPRAVVAHYGGASTEQVAGTMFLQLYRSKVQYFRKHLGGAGALAYKAVLLVAAVPRIFVPSLVMAFVPARRSRWRDLRQNYTSLLKALPAL